MKRVIVFFTILVFALHAQNISVDFKAKSPTNTLQMGDKPTFHSIVKNNSGTLLKGTVLYLSLVNLDKGKEHPVDLEDWAAQKAVHISSLPAKGEHQTDWSIRLINSGHYGLFVTAVLPGSNMPVTSAIVHFNVAAKKTVVPSRILPVAIGVPLLIIFIMIALWWRRRVIK
ncbi:MAG TPA: hypothetical protein ENK74_00355 [Nitratifractor sp.]|jgi:hypothetical protein|nr:hypothetical protein [Nitratifractor sp.]